MDYRTSFRGKLLLLTIAPLAIAQLITYFVVQNTAETEARQRAESALLAGAKVADELVGVHSKRLENVSADIARNPKPLTELVDRLAELTGLTVSIARRSPAGLQIVASSDTPSLSQRLRSLPDPGVASARPVQITEDVETDTLSVVTPLGIEAAPLYVVLQRSLEQEMQAFTQAGRQIVVFAIALLIAVAGIALLFSSRISRPLRSLTGAAQRMISGDYEAGISVASDDEFGKLANSFDAMRRAIAERELRISHQALHDSLTNLPNRSNILLQLASAIDAARDSESCVVILSIGLARMDEISSTIGHSAADELIKLAAEQIRMDLNPADCLGHTGSSEFVLILNDHDAGDALAVAERVAGVLESGVALERVTISLQTHMGIAEYPSHGNTPDELLRFASIARTDALQNKEPVCVYRSGREEEFAQRLRVVNDLRSAIHSDQLQVWYQPKAHLPAGVICGAEALVRWHHPELGFLPPDEFIPAAEKAGTIMHLTRYVLREAIRECRAWQDAGHPLAVSVNLATRDLLDDYLPYHVLQLLKEHDLPAHRLTLEITETSIMNHINQAMLVLECLRDMGVAISMDDFGTGHSSLSQLRAIPLNELKIDRSFIMTLGEDVEDQAIVRNTIELAHSMHLRVVAEGVEDEITMRRLADMGCEQAQGYFLCRPIPAIEVIDWLDAYNPISYAERRSSGRAFG